MKKKIFTYLASAMLILSFSSLKADVNVGVSFMAGQLDTSGHELENGATTDKNTKSFKEIFLGGSVFVEHVTDSGLAFGIDYVPVDVEIGDGKRTDTSTGTGSVGGNRSASASLEDLITVYANVPLGSNGVYALAGYHTVDVTTTETLPTASYGNKEINGYQVGIGKRGDNFKFEAFYSDFEDISITATGGKGSHKVNADADAMGFKLAFFY
jgi:hypothetical protein